MKELFVVKIGGNVIDDEEKLKAFLEKFNKIKSLKILVHGGGKMATELSEKLGVRAKMVDGKRITDGETLKIVTMVYAGLINKTIASQLSSISHQPSATKFIGICGADMNLIPAKKRAVANIDYGFVGDILTSQIPAGLWVDLLEKNICPIVAPITSDSTGALLNTNADTIASAVAQALSKLYKVTLIYCFEKDGVLQNPDDENSVIQVINPQTYIDLKNEKIISKGMLPKMDNSWDALKNGVFKVIIGNALKLDKLINLASGTQLLVD